VPIPVFYGFCVSEIYTGNILEIGRNESQNSYLRDTKAESKGETDGGLEGSRTIGWRGVIS
jgi:hypothetical protein